MPPLHVLIQDSLANHAGSRWIGAGHVGLSNDGKVRSSASSPETYYFDKFAHGKFLH